MLENRSAQPFLDQATKEEKKYNWLEAVTFYEKALNRILKPKYSLQTGEIKERIGYCFYRAAFQAETGDEFRRFTRQAFEAYIEASERFEEVDRHVWSVRCKVLAIWSNQWSASSYGEKRTLIDECIALWKKVTSDCENAKDEVGYGKACNELLECLLERFSIEQDWNHRKALLTEGMDYGEKAINSFSELADDYELTRAYYLTCSCCFWAVHYGELKSDWGEELKQKCLTFAKRAIELSRKTGDSYLIGMSNLIAAYVKFWLVGNLTQSMEHAEEVLNSGKEMRDGYLIGQGLIWLAELTFWLMMQEEDPDKKREECKKAIKHTDQAARARTINA